jgi:hypothetical protein
MEDDMIRILISDLAELASLGAFVAAVAIFAKVLAGAA